jgi:two-component system chemotaxis sensor kinase CheA
MKSSAEVMRMMPNGEFMAVRKLTGSDVMKSDLELLQRRFAQEAALFLDACDESLLSLVDRGRRVPALMDALRAYYSIMDASRDLDYVELAPFIQAIADCLVAYRGHPDAIRMENVHTLVQANDALRTRLLALEEGSDLDSAWNVTALLQSLEQIVEETVDPVDSPGALHFKSEQGIPESDPAGNRGPKKQGNLALKIDSARVDSVMDMVGELVVIKSQIAASLSSLSLDQRLRTLMAQLDKSVRELHERTLSMRMISLRSTFLKLQRTSKDVAHKLGKSVQFEVQGEDTEMDRAMVERIADPLMHLCRNAVDHGIESPERRTAAQKNAVGTISLKAFRKGESVLIEIADDGHGIDRSAVIKKAMDRKLLALDANIDVLSEQDIHDFLFTPGFSTAATITDVSGRGIGLDVVKANIMGIGGSIEIKSSSGQGTIFRLCLPLTTAITDGIVVSVSGCPYILPMETVIGFFESRNVDIIPLEDDHQLVRIKDLHYPFIRLGDYIGVAQQEQGLIILIEALGRELALQVDQVLGKTQVVLKPIGSAVGATEGLGGAAVMGNGKVALIIDVAGLAALSERMSLAVPRHPSVAPVSRLEEE